MPLVVFYSTMKHASNVVNPSLILLQIRPNQRNSLKLRFVISWRALIRNRPRTCWSLSYSQRPFHESWVIDVRTEQSSSSNRKITFCSFPILEIKPVWCHKGPPYLYKVAEIPYYRMVKFGLIDMYRILLQPKPPTTEKSKIGHLTSPFIKQIQAILSEEMTM